MRAGLELRAALAREALRSLRAHPLRSALTLLGVVIGVAAVVVVLAVGEGSRARVLARIQSLGGDLLLVTPGSASERGAHVGGGSGRTLTEADAAAIRREVPGIVAVAPSVYRRLQVVAGGRNWATTVQGVTPDYLVAREWRLDAGRPITAADLAAAARVALLGVSVAERLFPATDPLGQVLRVGGSPFVVVGVLSPKGRSSLGADQDDKLLVPLSAARSRVPGAVPGPVGAVQYVMLKVDGAQNLRPVAAEVRALLRQRHRLAPGNEDDFDLRNLAELQEARQEAAATLSLWLGAVASVSLVVGGISVMNIMLVSVAERRVEIGVRLAVGARPSHVREQFLLEAVTLSLLGALAGAVAGTALAQLVGAWASLSVQVRPQALALAVGAATAVGVASGLYPAVKAARLPPVEALRR